MDQKSKIKTSRNVGQQKDTFEFIQLTACRKHTIEKVLVDAHN